jgi:diadenosine tetraphosphate (Ap4A) HIT family hydrolase
METSHDTCFICRKRAGLEEAPPGGYVYGDEHWRVCHAPAEMAVPGQLFVESRRHFLDFAEMTAEEAASLGPLLARLVAVGKAVTGAERIYVLTMLDGGPTSICGSCRAGGRWRSAARRF